MLSRAILVAGALGTWTASLAVVPAVQDSQLKLELLAAAPEVVTPVGVAVDSGGRIFVVESHTHFPKAEYPGPKADRILAFDGRPNSPPTVFFEGLKWAMNAAFGADGDLYITHRNGVVRFAGAAAQKQAVQFENILQLETDATYPHNGVGGLAFGPEGFLYLGLGENLGSPYIVRGRDGSAVFAPEGAGGIVVRCRPDGSQVELWATGFWNAFGLEFDARGRLFVVDNDPDSRPPCRLLHVIRDGYYGFQFRHGRHGLSPFTAWNGELPGSLPMVAGTGEAPSGALDAARTRFPNSYSGALLIAATWANAIERYQLLPSGSSFRAQRDVIVQGDQDFRPVALAAAPDGSIVFTDWVKSDYHVHRHGKLWRLSPLPESQGRPTNGLAPNAHEARLVRLLGAQMGSPADLSAGFTSADPFQFSAAVSRLARQPIATITNAFRSSDPRTRVGAVLAARRVYGSPGLPAQGATNTSPQVALQSAVEPMVRAALKDPSADVRVAALVWVGEDRLEGFSATVGSAISDISITPQLFETHAETLRWLAKQETPSVPATAEVQIANLAMIDSNRLAQAVAVLTDSSAPSVSRVQAARDLAGTHEPKAVAALQSMVRDSRLPADLRAEALLALTGSHEDHVTSLAPTLLDAPDAVRIELIRALRPWKDAAGVAEVLEKLASESQPSSVRDRARHALGRSGPRPTNDAEWRTWLSDGTGDPEVGRRVFFASETSCAQCHRIEGRGGLTGPDLSAIARGADRERLLQSLINPSRDVAPQFAQEIVETRDGEQYSGRVFATGRDGALTLVNGEGTVTTIPAALIQERRGTPASLMPEGLLDSLTAQDLRDLMAFLESRK